MFEEIDSDLETELDNESQRILVNQSDFTIDVPLERDVDLVGLCPDSDIIQLVMYISSEDKRHVKMAVDNFFALLCYQICSGIASNVDVFPKHKIWDECFQKLSAVLETIPSDDHFRKHLFAHCPHEAWPKEVLNSINDMKSRSFTSKWEGLKLDAIKDSSHDRKMQFYMGYIIWTTYRETCAYILNHINQNFIHPNHIPAGYSSKGALRKARKELWPIEAERKGSRAHRTAESKRKKALQSKAYGHPVSFRSTAEGMSLETRTLKQYHKMTFDWYPMCWLTYLLVGLGSIYLDDSRCKDSYYVSKGLAAGSFDEPVLSMDNPQRNVNNDTYLNIAEVSVKRKYDAESSYESDSYPKKSLKVSPLIPASNILLPRQQTEVEKVEEAIAAAEKAVKVWKREVMSDAEVAFVLELEQDIRNLVKQLYYLKRKEVVLDYPDEPLSSLTVPPIISSYARSVVP